MKGWVSTYSNRPQPSGFDRPRLWAAPEEMGLRSRKRRAPVRLPRKPSTDFDDESATPTRPLPVLGALEEGGDRGERR
jgi:hypothetical protein